MIIVLFGDDDFRLRSKLQEIVRGYQEKHQSGLNFKKFSGPDIDFDNFKIKLESSSMFEEKKLLVLEDVLSNKDFYEKLLSYFKNGNLKKDPDRIVVVLNQGKLNRNADLLKWADMKEEFSPLGRDRLLEWIKQKVSAASSEIDQLAPGKLMAYTGGDLWRINSELNKLIDYKAGGKIEDVDVDLLVSSKLNLNIFQALDSLVGNDKAGAFSLLHSHLKQGESENYLFAMLAYQFRVLIKLKSLTEQGVPFSGLVKASGLHPFVVKKSNYQLKNFSLDKIKRLYKKLLQCDLDTKTGKINETVALDLFIAEV